MMKDCVFVCKLLTLIFKSVRQTVSEHQAPVTTQNKEYVHCKYTL